MVQPRQNLMQEGFLKFKEALSWCWEVLSEGAKYNSDEGESFKGHWRFGLPILPWQMLGDFEVCQWRVNFGEEVMPFLGDARQISPNLYDKQAKGMGKFLDCQYRGHFLAIFPFFLNSQGHEANFHGRLRI